MTKSKKQKSNENDKNNEKDRNAEIDEVRAQLARALADYDNLRKRIEKERSEYERILKVRIITNFLQIFDMLNDVQNNLGDPGLEIAINTFKDILKDENIEEIKAKPGMEFDEELHEAVEIVSEEGKDDGEIVDLQQTGWMFNNGKILRYAKVVVNKKGEN